MPDAGCLQWAVGSALALLIALALGDLLHTVARVGARDPSNWRDDFSGQIDSSTWHVGPPYLPLQDEPKPNGYWRFANPHHNEILKSLGDASIEGGYFHVPGKGVRSRHVFYPPLKIRARVAKPESDPNGLEHVVELRPLYGGLSLAPGWRCDADPFLELPAAEAAAKLARWPGGRGCFWNCSEKPVERTLEIAVDEEGVVSLADDAGCRSNSISRVGQPVHVILGCRARAPRSPATDGMVPINDPSSVMWPDKDGGKQERRTAEQAFPFPASEEVLSAPCPPERAAHFDWIEVRAKSSILDPGLEPMVLEGGSFMPRLQKICNAAKERWQVKVVPRLPSWMRGLVVLGVWLFR